MTGVHEPASPIDLRRLDRLTASLPPGGGRVAIELIDLILQDTPGQIARLSAAVSRSDYEGAAGTAHNLVGRWGLVGADLMVALCTQAEEAAAARDPHALHAAAERLSAEFGRVAPALLSERPRFL
jgi:HPt (histidine-containing phosphotransfer) domain-containing protein